MSSQWVEGTCGGGRLEAAGGRQDGEGVLDPGSRRQGEGTGIFLLFLNQASTAEPRNHPSVVCVWVLCGSAHELCIKRGALRGGPESHWCSGPWTSSFSPWPQAPRGVLQP